MTINQLKKNLKTNPKTIDFLEVLAVIDKHYSFTKTTFINGEVKNEAGQNSGSCKLFAFAKLQGLTKEETLACFGEHYQHVLEDPNGDNHQNIRNFMKTGFEGLVFEGEPLKEL